jgi:hypothetical protein
MEDKTKKYVAVLVSQIDGGKDGWYLQHEGYRNGDDFALWFCVWNTKPGKTGLELYHLPNRDHYDSDPLRGSLARGQLEQYKVWSQPLNPVIRGNQEQVQAQIDAFGELFAEFVKRQPADHYGILTTGHGGPMHFLGEIFEVVHAGPLLTKIREALGGKNLTFLDSMTNCNMGSYFILEAMATGVDYYLASALDVGGIAANAKPEASKKAVEAIRLTAGENYSKGFENKPDRTIKGCLIKLAEMQQRYWAKCAEDKDFNDMISKHTMQEVAIYDCSKVAELREALGWKGDRNLTRIRKIVAPLPTNKNCFVEYRNKYADMQSYVLEHKPAAKDALDKVMVYYTSNEQFGVDWPINNKGTLAQTTSHGMLIHLASWLGIDGSDDE